MELCHLAQLGLPLLLGGPTKSLQDCNIEAAATAEEMVEQRLRYNPPPPDASPPQRPHLDDHALAMTAHMNRAVAARNVDTEFSLISFNMLLKGFERKGYYPTVGAELRYWPYRREALRNLLLGLDADIYCMQEVECLSFAEEFAFLAQAGYATVAPQDDSKGKFPEIAKTAIFFKDDCFDKIWEDHRSRIVLAALRHRSSGRLLYVASCHLEGAPKEAATRFTQCKKALESIKRNQTEQKVSPESCAVVIAGDFNETDDGAVCHCLANGGLSKAFRVTSLPEVEITKTDFNHSFCLGDLYAAAATPWQRRPDTFCAPPEATSAWGASPCPAAVDFVFYSQDSLRPVAIREPFSADQYQAATNEGIPSTWHFSDHVPIGGIFELVPQGQDGAAKGSAIKIV